MSLKRRLLIIPGIMGTAIVSCYLVYFLPQKNTDLAEQRKQGQLVGVPTPKDEAIDGDRGVPQKISESDDLNGKLDTEIVTLYGTVKQLSTSGSVKFTFDEKMERGKFPNGGSRWFWGSVADSNLKYIDEHGNETFVMTGRRNDDDCDYTGDGTCIEDYDIYTVKLAE